MVNSTLLDHKRNEEILEELHVTSLDEKLCTYRHNWFQHVHRMEDYRLPKQLHNPKGRRWPGRPLKRLLDGMTAETETGHPGLNSWWNMMMMKLAIIVTRVSSSSALIFYNFQLCVRTCSFSIFFPVSSVMLYVCYWVTFVILYLFCNLFYG
jgi:hypothetical protein